MRIADIIQTSLIDGEGINLVIFLQGCPHHCKGCHNPATWDYKSGFELPVFELVRIIKKNPIITGVTFSGGEPLEQYSEVMQLSRQIKMLGLNITLYTGYVLKKTLSNKSNHYSCFLDVDNKHNNRVIQTSGLAYFDMIIDGKYIEELKTLDLPFRGSSNQRMLKRNIDY